jgi:hypothetical protein
LLEVAGVLAILTILAALAAPVMIRQVDRANGTKESADLDTFAEALTRSILRSKVIPASAGMPAAIASECSVPAVQVNATPWGTQRFFVVDPGMVLGSGLPYSQTGNAGLSVLPTAARIMLLSSLSRAHPLSSAETASTSANFDAIWAAPDGTVPATWTAWQGQGDELRIRRVNLAPLFHRLILVNHDPGNGPSFSAEGAPLLADLSTNSLWEAHYLEGTLVDLCVGTNLQTRHLLSSDISFVFESGNWSGSIGPGASTPGLPDTFARTAKEFLNAPWSPAALKGATPPPIVSALNTFMMNYTMWANECPHFSYHGNLPPNNPVNVPEYQLLNEFARPNGFIDQFSGTGGLLK